MYCLDLIERLLYIIHTLYTQWCNEHFAAVPSCKLTEAIVALCELRCQTFNGFAYVILTDLIESNLSLKVSVVSVIDSCETSVFNTKTWMTRKEATLEKIESTYVLSMPQTRPSARHCRQPSHNRRKRDTCFLLREYGLALGSSHLGDSGSLTLDA